jgi:uncharacterized protein DUF3105
MADSSKGRSSRDKQGYSVGAGKGKGKQTGGARGGSTGGTVSSGGGGRSPWMIGAIALAVVAVVAIGIGFFSVLDIGGGGGASAADFDKAAKAANCTVQDFGTDKGGQHLAATDPDPASWDSDPPTHGPHDPVWAVWGQYEQDVPQRALVHNLEHAGMVIQYGPQVQADQLAALKAAVLKDTQWTILAPYSKLGDKIAFEVWTHMAECTKFDEGVLAHYRAFRNKPGGSAESDQFPNGRDWSQEQRQPGW